MTSEKSEYLTAQFEQTFAAMMFFREAEMRNDATLLEHPSYIEFQTEFDRCHKIMHPKSWSVGQWAKRAGARLNTTAARVEEPS